MRCLRGPTAASAAAAAGGRLARRRAPAEHTAQTAPANVEWRQAMQRAIDAHSAAPRRKASNYPPPFAARMAGRTKRPLGDVFALKHSGANLTTLAPGAASALFHRHSRQDEFIFVLAGELVLVTEEGEQNLRPGHCFGFPAGGTGHHLVNRSDQDATYLEIGDR